MEDVEEWLEPLDYEGFWDEIKIFALDLPSREKCDQDIRQGQLEDTVLKVLKRLAQLTITLGQSLPPRATQKWRELH